MNLYRKTAIIVGVLFIIATVMNMLGNLSIKPLLDATDYLIKISANENQMIIAASSCVNLGFCICRYSDLAVSNPKEAS